MENPSNILNAVFDNLDDIVVVINSNHEIEEINKKGISVFNTDVKSILKLKCYNIICNKNLPEKSCPLLCLNQELITTANTIIKCGNRKYEAKASRIINKGITKYIYILHDITDTIQKELELQRQTKHYQTTSSRFTKSITKLEKQYIATEEKKKQYELLFSNMTSGFALHEIILDENKMPCDYRFIDCNAMFESLTGLKKENIIGKTVLEVLPGTEKYWIENYGKVALGGDPIEFTNYSKELGRYYETKSYSPQHGFFAVIFTDITNRKKSEVELQTAKEKALENEHRANILANISREIIEPELSVKKIADIIYNSCLELTKSQYGYVSSLDKTTGNNIGHTLSEMLADQCNITEKTIAFPKGEFGYNGLWGHSLNTKEAFFTNNPKEHFASTGPPTGHIPLKNFLSVPVMFNNKLMGQIALAGKTTPYNNNDLQLVKEIAIIYGIAIYRKEVEDNLTEAREKAEKADKLKSIFLANMSHEIRTPLNGIMGFSEILALKKELSDNQRKSYSTVIKKSSEQLIRIVDDILDISALENGSLDIVNKPYNISALLKKLHGIYKIKIQDEGKNIALQLMLPADKIILDTDDTRLNQVFTNLLENALKFTRDGCIHFGIDKIEKSKTIFFVKDTGIGIDYDNTDIIFDRFRQIEITNNRAYGGNGVGLSIVKEVLHLMGGDIWVESQLGKGTCFYFSLPYTPQKDKSNRNFKKDETPSVKTTVIPSLKILIVEDDEANVMLMKDMLEKISTLTDASATGREAIKKAKENNYDIILMDIGLPDISGLEATREIRKFNKHIPIIAQTAFAMKKDEAEAYNAGCTDYLSKPITHNALFNKIQSNI